MPVGAAVGAPVGAPGGVDVGEASLPSERDPVRLARRHHLERYGVLHRNFIERLRGVVGRMHRRPVDRLDQIAGEELPLGGTSRIHELQERPVAVILGIVGQPPQHHVGGVDLALVHLRERPLLLLLGRLPRRIQRFLGDHRQVGIEPCDHHPHRTQTAEADRRHDELALRRVFLGSTHTDQRLHLSRRSGAERVIREPHPSGEERQAEAEHEDEPREEAFGSRHGRTSIVREGAVRAVAHI
jgi:hypothetical protein